jgi:RNA polymerase sigma-70 factor (ECF subfamily)
MGETQDLVQVALVKALAQVDRFEPRREGAFLAYLRQIVLNEVRMEIRKAYRRPLGNSLEGDVTAVGRSPLQLVVESEAMEGYEIALARLSPEEREGVILRLELGFSHRQVAEALGKPSPDAARMLVARALAQEPKLLVLDEPTASLDFGNQVRVLQRISALAGSGTGVRSTLSPSLLTLRSR